MDAHERLGMASSLPLMAGLQQRTAFGDGADRTAYGDGALLARALPRLTQETELQKMLADERMRSDKHKTNYQTLKATHTRLQDDFIALQKELKSTIEECRLVQEKYTNIVEQARHDAAAKSNECEQLKSQVLDNKKLELIKSQVQADVEQPFREKFDQLNMDADRCRKEFSRVTYELAFLKSEYEHNKQEHQSVLSEMKLRHEAEVTNLRKERETMVSRLQSESAGDSQHLRAVQRENAQLSTKVKGLLSELEEIRAQREHVGLQADNVTRLQVKQLAEHASNIKALETEKKSLRAQCEHSQRELSIASEQQAQMSARIHELEKENVALRNRTEEVTHRSKLDLTSVRMEMQKERGELERQRDQLHNQLEDVTSQIDMLKLTITRQDTALLEKEREVARRVKAACDEEFQKQNALENEKLELESKLHELQQRWQDADKERRLATDKADEIVKRATEAKDVAERDANLCRAKLQQHQSLLDQLQHVRADNEQLRSRLQRVESQYETFVAGEQDVAELNTRLERQVTELQNEIHHVKEESLRVQEHSELVLTQSRLSWTDEKTNLQQRVEELNEKLQDTLQQLSATTNVYRQKKKRMKALVIKLRDRVSLQQSKVDLLQAEKETLKRSIPAEAHLQLKKQLRDIQRRNHQFRSLLLSSNIKQVPIGDMSFGSLSADTGMTGAPPTGIALLDMMDIAALQQRMDKLDSNQRQQLEGMKGNFLVLSPGSELAPDTMDMQPEKDVEY